MPCENDWPNIVYKNCDHKETFVQLRLQIDQLTRLLCNAGKYLQNQELLAQETIDWWMAHAKVDEEREKKEG